MSRSSLILGVCFLVLATFSSGCGRDQNSGDQAPSDSTVAVGDPRSGGTVIRRLESDCKTLNWVLYTTAYEDVVLRYLYSQLIEIDETMEYVPVLAKSWDVSDDHLRITIHLRDDIHWEDGVPVTADDVRFTMEKIRDPAIPAVNKSGYFDKLDHLETPDPQTVIFVWKEPYAPSLYAITQIWPIPKHVYGVGDFLTNPANRNPVGNGPFKFKEWRTSQSIELVRNDDYWGQKAYLDGVIFKVFEDESVALNALKVGELDEMRVTQIQWERQTSDADFLSRFNKYSYYVPSYNYIGWNCRSVFFNDRRVRLAMTLLFDRESVNAKIYSGFAKLVSGPFYINHWSYDRKVKPHPFDPAGAAALLDEAGWSDHDGDGIRDKNGQKFEFELLSTTSGTAKQLAQILQEECRRAGIRLNIRQLEGATFFDRIDSGEFDSCILRWRLDLDPDVFDTFHSSMVPPIGLNHGFYSNAKVDSLLEAGRVEFDQGKRAEIYHAIHRMMHDDPPYIFINTVPEKWPVNKRFRNVVISPNGPFDFYPGATYWYRNNDGQTR